MPFIFSRIASFPNLVFTPTRSFLLVSHLLEKSITLWGSKYPSWTCDSFFKMCTWIIKITTLIGYTNNATTSNGEVLVDTTHKMRLISKQLRWNVIWISSKSKRIVPAMPPNVITMNLTNILSTFVKRAYCKYQPWKILIPCGRY